MTLTLELPHELEEQLSQQAGSLGMPLSEYALYLLQQQMKPNPQNGAELVAYWQAQGLIGTRPEIEDSAAFAREIRATAERRNG